MAKTDKPSGRRNKPSYAMAVIGITLVLFIVGILSVIVLISKGLEKELKEGVQVHVFLRGSLRPAEKDSIINFVQGQPSTKGFKYIDKEAAMKAWLDSGEEDFRKFIDSNVLPTSLDINLKSDYVVTDTINKIRTQLLQFGFVSDVQYSEGTVLNMKIIDQAKIALICLAGAMALIAIILIDNTIRLAMFSNRFLIKTMQMVGATRGFIAKPMNVRAILNGALAAIIAIGLMYATILGAENFIPQLKALINLELLLMIFGSMLVLGILISYLSTQLSVNKYSKKKLDDLY